MEFISMSGREFIDWRNPCSFDPKIPVLKPVLPILKQFRVNSLSLAGESLSEDGERFLPILPGCQKMPGESCGWQMCRRQADKYLIFVNYGSITKEPFVQESEMQI